MKKSIILTVLLAGLMSFGSLYSQTANSRTNPVTSREATVVANLYAKCVSVADRIYLTATINHLTILLGDREITITQYVETLELINYNINNKAHTIAQLSKALANYYVSLVKEGRREVLVNINQ